jgi:hypothetical protein
LPVEESVSGAALDLFLKSYSMTRFAKKIQDLKELLPITPPGTDRHKKCLGRLADCYESKFYRTNDLSDIEESIKYRRLELEATHSSDNPRITPLSNLSCILFLAFKKTSKIGYLDESLSAMTLKNARDMHFHELVSSLLNPEQLLGRREDHHEAIRLISMVFDS